MKHDDNYGFIHDKCSIERKAKTQQHIQEILTKSKELLNDKKLVWFKIAFTDGENTEHMWVKVNALHRTSFRGTVDNVPVKLTNIKEDEQVTKDFTEIEDWYFHLLDN
jgi:uncharacterized protein YegJ (DUF2314 family)